MSQELVDQMYYVNMNDFYYDWLKKSFYNKTTGIWVNNKKISHFQLYFGDQENQL